MGFATYSNHRPDEQPTGEANAVSVNVSKTLAKCFGYMAIALVITALSAFGVGLLFTKLIFADYIFAGEITGMNADAFVGYMVVMIASFLLLVIDSFVMTKMVAKPNRSAWIPYIIYAILMGVFLSSFLVFGVDFATIGEAAGISAAVFGALFLVGWFSKKDLNVWAYIGISFLSILFFFGIFGLLLWVFLPGAGLVYNLIFSLALAVVLLIVIATDVFNIRRIIERGGNSDNLALYCAFVMYGDFVVIFVRILYYLTLLKDDSN